VEEFRLHQGLRHSRSPEFFDVQHYLNSRLGVPMVLHGAQESYSPHTDEAILMFWPDGVKVTEHIGLRAIEKLYEEEFEGRKSGGPGATTFPSHGRWKQV